MQVWRNWQTRMVQVHMNASSCRFKSCYLHQAAAYTECVGCCFFCFLRNSGLEPEKVSAKRKCAGGAFSAERHEGGTETQSVWVPKWRVYKAKPPQTVKSCYPHHVGMDFAPFKKPMAFLISLRHSSSSAKRHARVACSVASALAAAPCRYHLFAGKTRALFRRA